MTHNYTHWTDNCQTNAPGSVIKSDIKRFNNNEITKSSEPSRIVSIITVHVHVHVL